MSDRTVQDGGEPPVAGGATDHVLDPAVARDVAGRFGLGGLFGRPRLAATGWAQHNKLWHFETTGGRWAVKEIGRDPGPELEAAVQIEAAAYEAGIACPRPVRADDGSWLFWTSQRAFRCHEWLTGDCPTGRLTPPVAQQAGAALGALHRLDLPYGPAGPMLPHAWGEPHWQGLADRGAFLGLGWSGLLAQALGQIMTIEEHAIGWAAREHQRVGSHRDVRPDNTLVADGRLMLVDWDAAGGAVRGREVTNVLRWWAPHEQSFLDGYTSAAGPVDLDDGEGQDGGLLWWLELNVRLALDEPGDQHRQQAVTALLTHMFRKP